jgi:hypothetical protein
MARLPPTKHMPLSEMLALVVQHTGENEGAVKQRLKLAIGDDELVLFGNQLGHFDHVSSRATKIGGRRVREHLLCIYWEDSRIQFRTLGRSTEATKFVNIHISRRSVWEWLGLSVASDAPNGTAPMSTHNSVSASDERGSAQLPEADPGLSTPQKLMARFDELAGEGGGNFTFRRGEATSIYKRLACEIGYSVPHATRLAAPSYNELKEKRRESADD